MEYDAGKAAVRCIFVAIAIAVLLSVTFWGDWFAVTLSWVFAPVLAVVLGWVYGLVGAMFGFTPVDTDEDDDDGEIFGDIEVSIEEDPRFWLNDDDSGIVYSEEIVGKFKDANIHEWVLIDKPESNGEKIKCVYETVVDMDFGFNPPDGRWFILLEPGILYVAEAEPENSAEEQAETV